MLIPEGCIFQGGVISNFNLKKSKCNQINKKNQKNRIITINKIYILWN